MSYQVKTVFVSAGTTATLDLGYTAEHVDLQVKTFGPVNVMRPY